MKKERSATQQYIKGRFRIVAGGVPKTGQSTLVFSYMKGENLATEFDITSLEYAKEKEETVAYSNRESSVYINQVWDISLEKVLRGDESLIQYILENSHAFLLVFSLNKFKDGLESQTECLKKWMAAMNGEALRQNKEIPVVLVGTYTDQHNSFALVDDEAVSKLINELNQTSKAKIKCYIKTKLNHLSTAKDVNLSDKLDKNQLLGGEEVEPKQVCKIVFDLAIVACKEAEPYDSNTNEEAELHNHNSGSSVIPYAAGCSFMVGAAFSTAGIASPKVAMAFGGGLALSSTIVPWVGIAFLGIAAVIVVGALLNQASKKNSFHRFFNFSVNNRFTNLCRVSLNPHETRVWSLSLG